MHHPDTIKPDTIQLRQSQVFKRLRYWNPFKGNDQNIGIKQKYMIFDDIQLGFHTQNMKNDENNKKNEGANNENHILSVKT